MESSNLKTTTHASQASLVSSRGVPINANPKMGSRRIFTPQFKLQVLESYRNDSDCKGNQRATARKYNIHRRQIQKWLQCESSLRSSVANINHSSIKHQFHNVSVQHQQPQTQTQRHTIVTESPMGNSFTSGQRNSTHFNVESVRSEEASPAPAITELNNSTLNSQRLFDDSNLQPLNVVPTGINSTNTTCSSATTTAVITPLRPSPIISGGRDTSSSMSPVMHSHHHHYGIPAYNLSNTQHHLHSQVHQPHESSSYQYNKLVYPLTLPHLQTAQQPPSYFTPATINVISSTKSTTNSYTIANAEHIDKLNLNQLPSKNYPSYLTENSLILTDESGRTFNSSNMPLPYIKSDVSYSTAYPFGPMDLSMHHRRDMMPEIIINKYNQQSSKVRSSGGVPIKKEWDDSIDVVDLTFRKRKYQTSTTNADDNFPEKLPKLIKKQETSASNEDDDIEIEVGVEEKFPPSKPVKLFKPYLLDNCENKDNSTTSNICSEIEHIELTEKNLSNTCCTNKISNSVFISCNDNTFPVAVKENMTLYTDNSNFLVESRSLSPRSAFSPATSVPTLSPKNFQCPKGSPASSGYESSTSSYSDSSLSSRCETFGYGQTTYSINLRMQSIYSENPFQSKHVETWLDKDDPEIISTNSTIALLV